jgi:hypothetical protein
MGLCSRHEDRYRRQGRPGGARLPKSWSVRYEQHGLPVEVSYDDRGRFWDWCAQASAVNWPGQVNLRGLQPLVRAEIQWTLGVHAGQDRNRKWEPRQLQQLAHHCRDRGLHSLADLDPADIPSCYAGIVRVMLHLLRLVYFTPADTREAGFIETGHFGVRFPGRASHIDVTEVTQRWLRDLLWDHLAELMRSAHRPRCGGPVDYLRRACIELSAFLAADAPGGGHDPAALRAEHAQRFVSDQQHRARHGLASQGVKGPGGAPSTVTANTCCLVVNGVRRILRDAMDSGVAERLGLGREFITAIPAARHQRSRARRPFPDEVARALADDANLGRLAAGYDPEDQGMRDIWETIVCTGRRVSEVIKVRLDCIGRYGGLPMFWHDQTKVGNLDVAIRISGTPPPDPHRTSAQDRGPIHRTPRPCSGRGRTRCAGPVPQQDLQPARDSVPDLHLVLGRVSLLGRCPRRRPLRRASGPAHHRHESAAQWRDPDPCPPLPRARVRPDGRALRSLDQLRP